MILRPLLRRLATWLAPYAERIDSAQDYELPEPGYGPPTEPSEKEVPDPSLGAAISELVLYKNHGPLLDLLRRDRVRWLTVGSVAVSLCGRLKIENDRYFYLTVRRGLSSYSVSDLTRSAREADMLECAAVNAARVGQAVNCYDPAKPDYNPRT